MTVDKFILLLIALSLLASYFLNLFMFFAYKKLKYDHLLLRRKVREISHALAILCNRNENRSDN